MPGSNPGDEGSNPSHRAAACPETGSRLLLFDNCTVVPCDNATPRHGVASTRRGVTGARVVRVHAAEVRLLPSGRDGTQAHQDERPVEAREVAGSTPAGSAASGAQARATSCSEEGGQGSPCRRRLSRLVLTRAG